MPSNFLLLLPLVGGYLFNHILHKLRFRAQTLTGHRLILEAAVTGLAFLGIARVITVGYASYGRPELLSLWGRLAGEADYAGTAALSVVLAPLAAAAGNLILGFARRRRIPESRYSHRPRWQRPLLRWRDASRDYYLDRAIRNSGNALQKLLHQVAVTGWKGVSVGVTMGNGKIYAGYVTTSPNLSPRDEYVSLFPLLSGHRDRETLQIVYDFAYPLERFLELAAVHEVVVALPVSEIKSAHLLDEEYYVAEIKRLEAAKRSKGQPAG